MRIVYLRGSYMQKVLRFGTRYEFYSTSIRKFAQMKNKIICENPRNLRIKP
ncbi:MAG: hypothetical protein [Olavius algarvensis Gamma 1 endosymbiont]|nr:MAG: hypothetical protein [Olavius algarvensis Gamma 1 endosymbiont]